MTYLVLAGIFTAVSAYLWVKVGDREQAAFVMAIVFVLVLGEIADQLKTIADRLRK